MNVWVATPEELLEQEPILTELGLDPVVEPISWTTFGHLLLSRNQSIKALLIDPTAVVGIGPVYSDEILWQAGLRHDRASNELTSQEMRRLYRAVVETLHDGAKHRGTTLADGEYHDLAGKPGGYQDLLQSTSGPARPASAAGASSPRCATPRATCSCARTARSDRGHRRVPEVAEPQGLQVLRRRHRAGHGAGRHRRRRAQRQRQVQRGRRHRLGPRRPGARARCAARRWTTSSSPAPRRARRWGGPRWPSPSTTGPACCRSTSPRSPSPARCSARATASTPSTACRAACSTSRSCSRTPASGRQQHVIISQGQIDAVLNARPEDRRLIIEEAAGVLKFRRRKEKAERRLAGTEANLLRLQDLLREVRRQLRPLERQADAARRHGDLVAELSARRVHLAGPGPAPAPHPAGSRRGRPGATCAPREAEAELRAGRPRCPGAGRRGPPVRPRRRRPGRRPGPLRGAPRAGPGPRRGAAERRRGLERQRGRVGRPGRDRLAGVRGRPPRRRAGAVRREAEGLEPDVARLGTRRRTSTPLAGTWPIAGPPTATSRRPRGPRAWWPPPAGPPRCGASWPLCGPSVERGDQERARVAERLEAVAARSDPPRRGGRAAAPELTEAERGRGRPRRCGRGRRRGRGPRPRPQRRPRRIAAERPRASGTAGPHGPRPWPWPSTRPGRRPAWTASPTIVGSWAPCSTWSRSTRAGRPPSRPLPARRWARWWSTTSTGPAGPSPRSAMATWPVPWSPSAWSRPGRWRRPPGADRPCAPTCGPPRRVSMACSTPSSVRWWWSTGGPRRSMPPWPPPPR